MCRKQLRKFWVAFICCAFSLLPIAQAQKAAVLKKNGEALFAANHFNEALIPLSQYQQEKPGDLGVLTKLGICNFQIHNAEKAQQYLEYVLNQNLDKPEPEALYYLGRLFHAKSDYLKAVNYYKLYLRHASSSHPLRKNAIDNIKRCLSGQYATTADGIALVENLGENINTIYDEFAPLPSGTQSGKLYFATARLGCTGGPRDEAGYSNALEGNFCSDIYFASPSVSGWQEALPLDPLLNSARNEVATGFTSKGKILHFFRGFTLYSGVFLTDTAGSLDQYRTRENRFVSAMAPEDGDTAPFFFNDTLVLFASRRAGGLGGLDLYYTVFSGGMWTTPVNMGPNINTAYDDSYPFLAKNGFDLYFSSNSLQSIGGFDIWKSTFDRKKREWTHAVNMGLPLNSPGNDESFHIMPDGQSAVFASDRLESLGERDLFIAYFKEDLVTENGSEAHFLTPQIADLSQKETENEVAEMEEIAPLYYNSDKDVLSASNLKILDIIAEKARLNPKFKVLITGHTDETGPLKFDLYYGIKRAEMVGKALSDRDIPTDQLFIVSCGPANPIARNVLGTEPNPVGKQLNRRIEVALVSPDGGNDLFTLKKPEVPEIMASDAAQAYLDKNLGLSYRVQVAITRQILTNDALSMFNELSIEAGGGNYIYTAGLLRKHSDAVKLKTELVRQGFDDAAIVPYINGVRIGNSTAERLKKKFPDLENYLKK